MSSFELNKPYQQKEINKYIFTHTTELITHLENDLNEQFNQKSNYDFNSNKTLLKLYLSTSIVFQSIPNINKILILSLMNQQMTHFTSLLHFIPTKLTSTSNELKNIISLGHLLTSHKFIEFWTEYQTIKTSIANEFFESNIRQFILKTIRLTFVNLSMEQFLSFLGLNEAELSSFISSSTEHIEVTIFSLVLVLLSCSDSDLVFRLMVQLFVSLRLQNLKAVNPMSTKATKKVFNLVKS